MKIRIVYSKKGNPRITEFEGTKTELKELNRIITISLDDENGSL